MLITFYGDDFTGSTDVMESLARAGVRAALFLDPPSPARVAELGLGAAGVAGISRSLPAGEMAAHLRPIFAGLRELGAPIVHYKICSTFDSSPAIGSIGRAIEIGQEVFRPRFVPLVVGAPVLGRYCVFGNLFARSGLDTEPSRLDRHPTMSRHPLTPMEEADLRLHLARQTPQPAALLDVLRLDLPAPQRREAFEQLLKDGAPIVLFDVLYEAHLPRIGELIWSQARGAGQTLFAVGSSGLEYALVCHWAERGFMETQGPAWHLEPVEQLLIVSGSCAPVTARQLDWAIQRGCGQIALDTARLVDPAEAAGEIERSVRAGLAVLASGKSVILHTCRGPDDPRIAATTAKLSHAGLGRESSSRLLGAALGRILRGIWEQTDLPRAAVTGGDTSGYVARELGIEYLEMAAPIAPGAPLCRIAAPGSALHGREIIFKGGQNGRTEVFGLLWRDKRAAG